MLLSFSIMMVIKCGFFIAFYLVGNPQPWHQWLGSVQSQAQRHSVLPKPGCVKFTQVCVTSTQCCGTSTQKGVDPTQKGVDPTQKGVDPTQKCGTFPQMRCTQNDTRLVYIGDRLDLTVHFPFMWSFTFMQATLIPLHNKAGSALAIDHCYCLGTSSNQP